MEVQIKFVQIFSEIDSLNERLSVLGQEAKMVLGQMLNEGVKMDVVIPFLAKARKAEWANAVEGMEGNVTKERRKCNWWNRGYCREKEGCLFAHPREDCQDHLKGGCNNRGCTLRHRRACKFLSSEVGCVRGDMCAYLHLGPLQEKNKVENDVEVLDKTTAMAMENKEVQTKVEGQLKTMIMASKEVQARFETETCVCKEPIFQNKVVIEEDKIICVFKRVKCSEEEWTDVEETVEEWNIGEVKIKQEVILRQEKTTGGKDL